MGSSDSTRRRQGGSSITIPCRTRAGGGQALPFASTVRRDGCIRRPSGERQVSTDPAPMVEKDKAPPPHQRQDAARPPRLYADAPRLPEAAEIDVRELISGKTYELEIGPGRGGF